MEQSHPPVIITAAVVSAVATDPHECPVHIHVDPELLSRLVAARQAVTEIAGAVSMTLEAGSRVQWPVEALAETMASQGLEWAGTPSSLNEATYADVGEAGLVFYAGNPGEGESIDTPLISFDTLHRALETGHADHRDELVPNEDSKPV